ncbi:hypothetical protein SAMN04487936_105217 [Halobacillus dabanensis]|uniref:Uncharacterized protein n=1 Tax=Halobacillus dabanensis TaxID=240302 RepID=A0A1I3VAP2_HALDA|nr:hypothetical protein SAMN04487936_105217 [Halobacillus dabanensis]
MSNINQSKSIGVLALLHNLSKNCRVARIDSGNEGVPKRHETNKQTGVGLSLRTDCSGRNCLGHDA